MKAVSDLYIGSLVFKQNVKFLCLQQVLEYSFLWVVCNVYALFNR